MVRPLLFVVVVAAVAAGSAARRPRYGGTLHIEMAAQLTVLDPRQLGKDIVAERILPLVFERLVRLDETGGPQPALASSWEHDAEYKRWRFRLSANVKFHDGVLLAPAEVVAAWSALEPWHTSVSGEWLVIECEQPAPNLPAELARGSHFVFRVGAEGHVIGTGPFRMVEWQPGSRLLLAANENYWGGRPFLDSVAIQFGASPAQQFIDWELGKADLVELLPEQLRRAPQQGRRVWSSSPIELLALVFDPQRPSVQDERLRRAIALALDRSSIANVLLQRQAEVAGGLLPQWLSGYAFLFPVSPDPVRARELRSEVPKVAPLALSYDARDAVARAVAERIVVNVRDAGLNLQLTPRSPADVRLARLRLAAAEPQAALAELAASLGIPETASRPGRVTLEEVYAAERAWLDSYRVVPVVHLRESYGLGSAVRNWMPLPWGAWRLEEVWLDPAAAGAARGGKP